MKKVVLAVFAALWALASCSPSLYEMSLDIRYPSSSGIEIPGRTVSVVCLQEGSPTDSLTLSLANGFAEGVESMFFDGKQVINLLTMQKDPSGVYSQRDSMLLVLLEVDTDILFLVDVPEVNERNCKCRIYAYDAHAKLDTVKTLYSSGTLDMVSASWDYDARRFGSRMSSPLASSWRKESHPLYYFEDIDTRWYTALAYADEMNWQKALEVWLEMSKSKMRSYEKRSCLYYNLAVGCYMLERYDLALEWLDRSDAEYKLPLSATLRRRIINRRG